MQEIEMKALLNTEQYRDILKTFVWDECFSQINFYYSDINNYLYEKKITVRVRANKEKLKLQVKVLLNEEGAVHKNIEYEKEIKTIPYKISKKILEKICEYKVEFDDVYLQGYLVTERCVNRKQEGVEVCLDKNIYLDKIDYELEIEYVERMPNWLLDHLIIYDIDIQNDCKGKYTRFMELLLQKG